MAIMLRNIAEKPMTYRRKANDISPKSQCRFGDIYSSFRQNSVTHSILHGFQCGFPLFSHHKSVKILTTFCKLYSERLHLVYKCEVKITPPTTPFPWSRQL